MNKKFIQLFVMTLLFCSLVQAQELPYGIGNLVFDYIESQPRPLTFDDFQDTNKAKEIIRLHNVWSHDYAFLFYRAWRIPEPDDAGEMGILYHSGKDFDTYQKRLHTSYNLTDEIHNELSKALDLACKICVQKQRIKLQNCPQACYNPGL